MLCANSCLFFFLLHQIGLCWFCNRCTMNVGCVLFVSVLLSSNHNGSTPLVLAKRRGVNKDAIRLLEGLEEQEVKGFNRGAHSKLETMQMAESER